MGTGYTFIRFRQEAGAVFAARVYTFQFSADQNYTPLTTIMAPMQQTIGATANPNIKIFLPIIIGYYNFSSNFSLIYCQDIEKTF